MFASVRFVLDIWEGYFGRTIQWHFRQRFTKMELIPQVNWNNAHSGFGFLEFGVDGNSRPYCRNFDVLAHELGHSIIFAEIPNFDGVNFGGFHESAGDLVAIMSSLHFDLMVDRLLANTFGNLFSRNELSRLGELSNSRQIRIAFNDKKMSDIVGISEEHALSVPLTGAIFDIMVEVFQVLLRENGVISAALADFANNNNKIHSHTQAAEVQRQFKDAFNSPNAASKFKACLIKARDYLGKLLAKAWQTLGANTEQRDISYQEVGNAIVGADDELTGGKFFANIQSCFAWRQIRVRTPRHLWIHNVCGPAKY